LVKTDNSEKTRYRKKEYVRKNRQKEKISSMDLIRNQELLPTEEETKIPRKSIDLSIINPEIRTVKIVETIIKVILRGGKNSKRIKKIGIL
jgi:hypothetical protein